MSRLINEIVILTLQPGISPEEPINALNTILFRQEGFRCMAWGRWEEESNKAQLLIRTSLAYTGDWDDLSSLKKFEQSSADLEATLRKVLEAPVVEVATSFSGPTDFKAGAGGFLDLVASSVGCVGVVHEEIVEDIVRDAQDTPGKGSFAALGWASGDAHMKAVREGGVQNKVNLIIGVGKAKQLEMHHVEFAKG
ncbi:hypothetical protein BJX64DRAFT_291875 [Aspergillus heterothallicus]